MRIFAGVVAARDFEYVAFDGRIVDEVRPRNSFAVKQKQWRRAGRGDRLWKNDSGG
jgi:hypothetical protein